MAFRATIHSLDCLQGLNPQQFQQCFLNWIKAINKITLGEVVAFDGKYLRHSYDKGAEQEAIHMVSAWATQNRLVLGQVKVDKKSNEITAIPELIKKLELSGCIVTIDAIGCQQKIVNLITEQNADYIITLKKHQGQLYKNVSQLFKEAISNQFKGIEHSEYHTREQGHGREEIRHYLMLTNIDERVDPNHKWSELKSIGLVERSRRRVASGPSELWMEKLQLKLVTTSVVSRMMPNYLVNQFEVTGELRTHCIGAECRRVEEGHPPNLLYLMWPVNVDNCRIRKDNAPENFALMRRLGVNLLGREKSNKRGVKNKQFLAAMNNEYLAKVLAAA